MLYVLDDGRAYQQYKFPIAYDSRKTAYQRTLFPDPAKTEEIINNYETLAKQEEHTIATDPQQRSVLLPLSECVAFDKPLCCPVVLAVTCSIVVDGRVRRSQPCPKLLARLVPCEHVSATTIDDRKNQEVTNVGVHPSLL